MKFATTSQFDLGVRSPVGRHLVLDVGLYRKDLPQYAPRVTPYADPRSPTDTITVNAVTAVGAYGLGGNVQVEWRAGEWLSGSAAYSLLRVQGDRPFDDNTTHAVSATLALRVPPDWRGGALGMLTRDLSADLILRATNGLPYTRLQNAGFGTVAPGLLAGRLDENINASRLPWTKRVDLRLTRVVRAGGRAWTVYADLRNVLNFRNIVALFAETGSVVNDRHRFDALAAEYDGLRAEASAAGALQPDTTINLSSCGSWSKPVNCVALTRVERRFGDGNGLYTLTEQQRALNAYYDDFFGAWRFYGPGRTLRFGVELEL
jgi:hypothetical protein